MDAKICQITDLKNPAGKILGVDFGDTRTGLAVSDATRFLASGIGTISVGGIVKTADRTAEIAREQGAVAIVVGLPVNMDGTQGVQAVATPCVMPILTRCGVTLQYVFN